MIQNTEFNDCTADRDEDDGAKPKLVAHLTDSPHCSSAKSCTTSLAVSNDACTCERCADCYSLMIELRAVLDAISYGELLAASPPAPEDRRRHQSAVALLDMLHARTIQAFG